MPYVEIWVEPEEEFTKEERKTLEEFFALVLEDAPPGSLIFKEAQRAGRILRGEQPSPTDDKYRRWLAERDKAIATAHIG